MKLLRSIVEPIPALLIFISLCGLFAAVLHPWMMNWGATREEQMMALPGDRFSVGRGNAR